MTKSYIKKVSFKLFLEGVQVRCRTYAVTSEVDSKREGRRTRRFFNVTCSRDICTNEFYLT